MHTIGVRMLRPAHNEAFTSSYMRRHLIHVSHNLISSDAQKFKEQFETAKKINRDIVGDGPISLGGETTKPAPVADAEAPAPTEAAPAPAE